MHEDQIINSVASIFSAHLGDVEGIKLYIIGSRAAGTHRPTSDFDFWIETQTPLPANRWDRFRSAVAKLPTLYRIDLVLASETDQSFINVVESQTKKEIAFGKITTQRS